MQLHPPPPSPGSGFSPPPSPSSPKCAVLPRVLLAWRAGVWVSRSKHMLRAGTGSFLTSWRARARMRLSQVWLTAHALARREPQRVTGHGQVGLVSPVLGQDAREGEDGTQQTRASRKIRFIKTYSALTYRLTKRSVPPPQH